MARDASVQIVPNDANVGRDTRDRRDQKVMWVPWIESQKAPGKGAKSNGVAGAQSP